MNPLRQLMVWAGGLLGFRASQSPHIRASLDFARNGRMMDGYWINADMLSANAAYNHGTQKIARARARYEMANNGFVQRMVLLKAHDVIGTTPRLQLKTQSSVANRYVEQQFGNWSKCVHLGARLRLLHICRQVDGAALALKTYNPALPHAVKMDLRVIDVDRLHTPDMYVAARDRTDGLTYDPFGNLLSADILRDHPNADYAGINPLVYDTVPAEHVLYWISKRRAEQDRGITEIGPLLNLCGQQRRYTLSVLAAAELAAQIAGVVKTTSSTVDVADESEVGDALQVEMGQLLTLPRGWDISQIRSEQPTNTFGPFSDQLAGEAANTMLMPRHKATGRYDEINYSAGRLASCDWRTVIDIERHDLGEQHLTPLLFDFSREMALRGLLPETAALSSDRTLPLLPALQGAAGYMEIIGRHSLSQWLYGQAASPTLVDLALAPRELRAAGYTEAALLIETMPHEWFWDAPQSVDAVKENTGTMIAMAGGLANRKRALAQQGVDIDVHDAEAAESFGLTVEEYRRAVAAKVFSLNTDSIAFALNQETDQPTQNVTPAPQQPAAASRQKQRAGVPA